MSTLSKENDDAALEQLFAEARKYPLLTAEQERDIDVAKWHALQHLLEIMSASTPCCHYLSAWATNVLDNPPSLEDFAVREHYYLLRREHVGLLEGGEQREALITFNRSITRSKATKHIGAIISALELPAGLIAGMAETVSSATERRGVAAALHYWHQFWPQAPTGLPGTVDTATLSALRDGLSDYYKARQQLVNHNLRLVFSIAGRLTRRGAPYRDLIQNGVIGLIRAAEKYQQDKGYRFSTYAYNWVNQAVRHTIEDLQGIVRYPSGVNEQISRLHRERMNHIDSTGHEPDVKTLARRLKMKPAAVQRLQQVTNLSVSLDSSPFDDADGPALGETLSGGPFSETASQAEQESLNRCLMQRIKILEPSEQRVVIRRWGLDKSPPLTRAEIAEQMEVSTEWVRQLESSALAKLRKDEGMAEVYQDHRGASH
jgi:RNA polymerase sigma factor (sigma-70 family)